MRLTIHAKPGARKQAVEFLADGSIRVWLRATPVDGKANDELIECMAKILGLKKKEVRIHTGANGRFKLLDVDITEEAAKSKLEQYKI